MNPHTPQTALSEVAALAPSPLTAPDVAVDENDYFADADGEMDDDEFDAMLREKGQYVHWEQVARNLAAVVPDGPAIFERQRSLHTFSLDDALDALPPGVKAWLLLLRGRVTALEQQVVRYEKQTQTEVSELETRLAALETAQEDRRYANRMTPA